MQSVGGTQVQKTSAEVRAKLSHPVVDSDGHAIECGPVFLDYLKKVGGADVAHRYEQRLSTNNWYTMTPEERQRKRVLRPASWTLPARNTYDRATAMLPSLLCSRMDDFGIDFSVVFSTLALSFMRERDDELRRAACRALNEMFADIFRSHGSRTAPVASIPAHTPEEAIEELDYAVEKLGFKAVTLASHVMRPIPAAVEISPDVAPYATWIDNLCIDSPYNYDPLWERCVHHKVAVTQHAIARGWGSRNSTSHYIYDHVGSFAAAGEAFAKALVLGGVTKRFPQLAFAFLEGGVAWGTELYSSLVGHCSKRNPTQIGNYDPDTIDMDRLIELFDEYGDEVTKGQKAADLPNFEKYVRAANARNFSRDDMIAHELENLGITKGEDLRPLFENNFYFGCEADDPLVAIAFNSKLNPFGAKLKAIFSSDLGHWDMPDMNEVLKEAYELVERELLDETDFKSFMFTNPVTLHTSMNPNFFDGTKIESEVKTTLNGTG